MKFENVSGFMLVFISIAPAVIYLCVYLLKRKKGNTPLTPEEFHARILEIERQVLEDIEREKKSKEQLEYSVG